MITKICSVCGSSYTVPQSRNNTKFCSHECYDKFRSKKECVCIICGVHFKRNPSEIKKNGGKYCSVNCYLSSKNKSEVKHCKQCNKKFKAIQSDIKKGGGIFCSKKCYHTFQKENPLPLESRKRMSASGKGKIKTKEWKQKIADANKGEKCYCWKNGITPLTVAIRTSTRYKQWQWGVFKRYGGKDWFSGCKGTKRNPIEIHHIVKFSTIIEKYNITTKEEALSCDALWSLDNGVCMMKTSHRAYHEIWD